MRFLIFLFLLTSCSLLRPGSSLKTKNEELLLKSVRLTGEGKGRLTLNQRQYVFNIDSVLNDNYDWIFAVSIPLQGEEVMMMPDLRVKEIQVSEAESFEARIGREFHRLKLKRLISSDQFFRELRSLIRFHLSHLWGQKKVCQRKDKNLICEQDQEEFIVTILDKEFLVSKMLRNGVILQLLAKNLTDSFFSQTDIRLFSSQKDLEAQRSSFSMELFW